MLTKATTSALKTKSNMAKLAHINITQGGTKEDQNTDTTIKKGTKDYSEGYEDDAEGELPKKMTVTNIIYTCTIQRFLWQPFHLTVQSVRNQIYIYKF